MRKLLILLFLIACTSQSEVHPLSQDELVINNAELYLQKTLNDPNSYEFQSLVLVDSVTYQQNIDNRIEMFERNYNGSKTFADGELKKKNVEYLDFSQSTYDRYLSDMKKEKKIIDAIDSVRVAMGESVNDIASYTYIFRFRAANAFGALVVNEYYLQTDNELNVINLADDFGKMYSTPNVFPGYEEIIQRF